LVKVIEVIPERDGKFSWMKIDGTGFVSLKPN
jgi:hypothetical protein